MRFVLAAAMVAILAGCSAGGSGNSGCTANSTAAECQAQVADLSLALSKNELTNTGADSVTLTVIALDSNRNALSGATIAIVPDSGIATVASTTTDASGKVTAKLEIGGDTSNRLITVRVSSGGVVKTVTLPVTGNTLVASASPSVIAPGATGTIDFQLVNANNVGIANTAIAIDGPNAVTAATDANGHYIYSYTAPGTAGTLNVTAQANGVSFVVPITVSSGTVAPGDGPIMAATLTANPNKVAANTSTDTTNQNSVEVRALFLGTNSLPLKNIRVRFDLDGDVNNVGGSFSSGSNYVYSDDTGYARTQYIPGARSSGNNKVTIRACYSQNDFAAVASGAPCPNNQEILAQVTVTGGGISVTWLSDNQIYLDPQGDPSQYYQRFSVQVTDSAGNPKAGVKVSASSKLTSYYRGYFGWNGTQWVLATGGGLPENCQNEDMNGDGSRADVEDANSNGELEPRPSAAAVYADPTKVNADVTDAYGKAYFWFAWGKNHSYWDSYRIDFSAIVDTSESYTTVSGDHLPVPAAPLKSEGAPPFAVSPYGAFYSPVSAVTFEGITANLCTRNGDN